MKWIFIILFFSISSVLHAETYYISPAGKDSDSNTGSSSSPWKTLAFACSKVTTPGNTIHVNAGTYVETVQSLLAVGVSIEGEGISSNIISYVSKQYMATIILYSANEGTNGNQHISNLKLDGSNLTAWGAIKVCARSNVSIHDLTIENFRVCGVIINGGVGYLSGPPDIYGKGNTFFNNTVSNCSIYENGSGQGALRIGGQDGLTIYNNILTQIQRAPGSNGYLIKFYSYGYNKGLKIFNNTITKAPYDGITWPIAVELWYSQGGIEIYNNEIIGQLNLVNNYKNSYDYSMYIHHNIIGPKTMLASLEYGITFESDVYDVIVCNNYIRNNYVGISFAQLHFDKTVENIFIINNIIDGVGVVGNNGGHAIYWTTNQTTSVTRNINIWANVFNQGPIGNGYYGIKTPTGGTVTNVSIRNNIIKGFGAFPIDVNNQVAITLDNLSIENNILYNNGNGNDPRFVVTPTNLTIQNNIKANPLFVSNSDFHLQTGSPGIGKGFKILELTTDYDGNLYKDPPSIGAYEYDSHPPAPAIPVYQSSVVENASPDTVEMTYDLSLADTIPATTAFTVKVNGVNRNVSSVAISGKKVLLALDSAVVFGDSVTVSYNKPGSNWIQSTTGGAAESINAQPVTNNCLDPTVPNDPPTLVIKNDTISYSGFVGEIDASDSDDLNNDVLTYEWTVPNNVSVSSTNSPKIQFLSPVVSTEQVFEFILEVNDGRVIQSSSIPINILPYKPELAVARITNIKASDYQVPDNPDNVIDDNLTTKWSVNGDNQWLLFNLAVPFKINHLELAFLQGQKYESYFDIYASRDNLIWEPILTEAASCNFSGDIQVFDFPALKINTEYSYVKLIGHGNSLNTWNYISEFKIYGFLQEQPASSDNEKRNIIIYPNPAQDFFNISIEEPTLELDKIRLINLFGMIVFEDSLEPGIKNIQIPNYLNTGVYIVELSSGSLILDAQKLMINK